MGSRTCRMVDTGTPSVSEVVVAGTVEPQASMASTVLLGYAGLVKKVGLWFLKRRYTVSCYMHASRSKPKQAKPSICFGQSIVSTRHTYLGQHHACDVPYDASRLYAVQSEGHTAGL